MLKACTASAASLPDKISDSLAKIIMIISDDNMHAGGGRLQGGLLRMEKGNAIAYYARSDAILLKNS